MAHNRDFMKQLFEATQPRQQTPAGYPAGYPVIGACTIGPQPLPVEYHLGEMRGPDGTRAVILQLSTPLGVHFYFFDPDGAVVFAEKLRALASAGLVVPDDARVPNGGS